MERTRVLIMGAAGRDFHNFNVFFRDNPAYEVIAFTATQIPNIEGRLYPPSLSGDIYPAGIQILPEEDLLDLIKDNRIEQVVFSYSDVSHEYVMHKASTVLAAGADFRLMGRVTTELVANKPVISVCAARTGSGKSQTTRYIAGLLRDADLKVAAIRHPMPYGDLSKQAVQRFANYKDLDLHECSIEEREEYEPHLDRGVIVFAGVDYAKILDQAEKEVDVILWDGGNNDLPFYRSDLHIVVVDPHRPGHELRYHPGEANVRAADVLLINKIDTAEPENIRKVEENIRSVNPNAILVHGESPISVDDPEAIRGKRVLVVEDGPTLTHGEMAYGAGWIAAKRFGAAEIIDPRPFATGSIAEIYEKYPTTGEVLPAMGYGDDQMRELQETINRVDADLVLIGTPIDLRRLLDIKLPTERVRYELAIHVEPSLKSVIAERILSKISLNPSK